MSSLVDLWADCVIMDPLKDIRHVMSSACNEHNKKNIANGLDTLGLTREYTPLMMLWMRETVDRDAIRELILYGANLNQKNHTGMNSLHIIIQSIFHKKEYIHHLEWWLNMGADPNIKIINFKEKRLYNALELFLWLLEKENWSIHEEFVLYPLFQKRVLDEEEIRQVIFLFLSYDSEESVLFPDHPAYKFCRTLNIVDIDQPLLKNHSILEKKLASFWKISWPVSDFYLRHRFLTKFFKDVHGCQANHIKSNLYINKELEDDQDTPVSYYIPLPENNKTFYFYTDMIPYLIESSKNPMTNRVVEIEDKRPLLKALEKTPNFSFRTKWQNFSNYPILFDPPEKPMDIHSLSEMIQQIIQAVHPYSNSFMLRRFTCNQIHYTCRLFTEEPYFLENFQENQDTINLKWFLLNIMCLLVHKNNRSTINKIYFGIEESIEDYKMYQTIVDIFQKTDTPFSCSFYDAISNYDIFSLLYEKVGFHGMTDMAQIWIKMNNIYGLENNLSENTFPMLLES